jgi:hypothetical protein
MKKIVIIFLLILSIRSYAQEIISSKDTLFYGRDSYNDLDSLMIYNNSETPFKIDSIVIKKGIYFISLQSKTLEEDYSTISAKVIYPKNILSAKDSLKLMIKLELLTKRVNNCNQFIADSIFIFTNSLTSPLITITVWEMLKMTRKQLNIFYLKTTQIRLTRAQLFNIQYQ